MSFSRTKPDSALLRRMAMDPREFRMNLLIDAGDSPRPYGDVYDDRQEADFAAADDAWRVVMGVPPETPNPIARFYSERPRGSSKSSDASLSAIHALTFSKRPLTLVAAACDRDQAGLIIAAARRLVACNPWLATAIETQTKRIVGLRTGGTLDVLSSDADSNYGLIPHAILLDELVHWNGESGERLFHSLFSGAIKRKSTLVSIITNAGLGRGTSWQWSIREKARDRDDWHFSRWDSPAKWISATALEEQRDLLPDKVFRRLHLNEWSDDTADLLRAADVQAACTLPGPAPGRDRNKHHVVVCGVDVGLRRDSSAVVTTSLNLETQRASLLDVRGWSPKDFGGEVLISTVEDYVREITGRFNPNAISFDSWQFEGSAQKLCSEGLNMCRWPTNATSQDIMARTLLRYFYERRIDLFPDHLLLKDLGMLGVVESTRNKTLKIVAPRDLDGHCDRGIAFCISLAGLADVAMMSSHTQEMQFGLAVPG